MVTEHAIAVSTHGRYLAEAPSGVRPAGLIVGCHGYGEPAEAQLERLRGIAGASVWLLVSVQGLHRFYRGRTDEVVASWMTRQDRELAISDNVAYVNAVVDRVVAEAGQVLPLIFAGFSQGVAMAYRAGCASQRPVAGIVAVGGDIPPELTREALARVPVAIVARGKADDWYSASKSAADGKRLRDAGVDVHPVEFDGGHEWHPDVSREAGVLLERVRRRRA
jgi:predicted esterase